MGGTFRVLVADDDPAARRALCALVELALGPDVALTCAGSAAEAIAAADAHDVELALVDFEMPGGGPAAARGIRLARPRARLVAVSGHDDAATVREMLQAGASTFLVKGMPVDDMVGVLRRVLDGEPAGTRPTTAGITVLVVEADPRLLEEASAAFDRAAGVQLTGAAQTAFHAAQLAARYLPDVAIVGTATPPEAMPLPIAITGASPRTRVVEVQRRPAGRHLPVLGSMEDLVAVAVSAVDAGRHTAVELPATAATAYAIPSRRHRFQRLRDVIDGEELDIVLQPILGLGDGDVVGYEALSRFPPPTASPDVWFSEARREGIGVELELLAVRAALKELPRLAPDAFLAVNVSPDTVLDPAVPELIEQTGWKLVLELTEHAVVEDYAVLRSRLEELRNLGARIAVDDCGAGYSSLRHVAMIMPDFLKLDVFLCRDAREPVRTALIRALATFAGEMQISLIAEGIEQADDLEALQQLGVPLGQGYLLGRPAPAGELLG